MREVTSQRNCSPLKRWWIGSKLGWNLVLTKDVKSCTYCCFVRYMSFDCKNRRNAMTKNSYNELLEISDKRRAIKGLIVCNSLDVNALVPTIKVWPYVVINSPQWDLGLKVYPWLSILISDAQTYRKASCNCHRLINVPEAKRARIQELLWRFANNKTVVKYFIKELVVFLLLK